VTSIATKAGIPIAINGLLAISCECCESDVSMCEGTCPGVLEDVAADLVVVVSNFRSPLDGNGFLSTCDPFTESLFRATDSLTCAFHRMQEDHAAYSSNESLSQSLGLSEVPLSATSNHPAMQNALSNAQAGDKLVEVFVPCNLQTQCSGDFVKIRCLEAHQCVVLGITTRIVYTNLDASFQIRPTLTCEFVLCGDMSSVNVRRSPVPGLSEIGLLALSIQPILLP
jgi:hypothetical protein